MKSAVFALLLLAGCSSYWTPKLGPFESSPLRTCKADPDCPPKQSCRFPHVDSHPVCMNTGWNDADDFVTTH